MKNTIILFLFFMTLEGCKKDKKNYLNEIDRIELINTVINSTEFYNNISVVYRDSIPTLILNNLTTKEVISKVKYHSLNVRFSEKDSTNLIKWKSDWRHPKFYINFEKFEVIQNKVIINLRLYSTGVFGKVVFEFKEGKWILISQKYSEM